MWVQRTSSRVHYILLDNNVLVGRSDMAWIARALAVTQLTQPSLKMSVAREARKARKDHFCFYLSFTASQITSIVETTTCGGFPLSEKKRTSDGNQVADSSAFTVYQCAMRCSMRWDESKSCEQWKSETLYFSDLETTRTADWWIQFFRSDLKSECESFGQSLELNVVQVIFYYAKH